MHALIVISHPDRNSLTHAVGERIAAGISASSEHSFEIADLAAENFDPRFGTADLAVHLKTAPAPVDVAAEHTRIERADALILVYPVYWWSMPGLLKGWIDRVFTNGWAYDEDPATPLRKKLSHLPVHLIGIGGARERTYSKRGYGDAMRVQIDQGIFDYCGAPVATSEILFPVDAGLPDDRLERAYQLGREVFGLSVTKGSGHMA